MAQFYFHLDDGSGHSDTESTELPNLAAARKEALRFAGALVSNLDDDFWTNQEWVMRVTDDRQLTLFSLMLTASDAPAARRG